MSSMSIALRKQIERMLESMPLQENEYRRIDGMGSHYISLRPEYEGKQYFLSMVYRDMEIFIFKLTETTT